MKNKLYVTLAAGLLGTFPIVTVLAADTGVLEQFSRDEIVASGGACFIVDTAKNVVIASKGSDQVKIAGKIMPLKRDVVSLNSLKWTADDLSIIFTVPKTKTLEADSGKSPWGTLKITYKGVVSSIRAQDQCDGD